MGLLNATLQALMTGAVLAEREARTALSATWEALSHLRRR